MNVKTDTAAAGPDWQETPLARALDTLGNPIMVAGPDHVIRFANEAAYHMFEAIEADIRKDLPHFRARDVVGKTVDVFHKSPHYQRRILEGLTAPHYGKFTVGGKHLAFCASPIMGDDGKVKNVFVEWQDRTSLVETKTQADNFSSELAIMAKAHIEGRISVGMSIENMNAQSAALAQTVNDMVFGHIDTKRLLVRCVEEFANGNFDFEFAQLPLEKAFLNEAVERARTSLKGVSAEIERMSKAINDGALDIEIRTDRFKGDYRRIVESFENAFRSLNKSFSQVSEQVEQVSITVTQMSQSSQSLATNAQIQSSSVDQVSSSAEETDTQVKANAAAASSASQLVGSASVVAADGRDKIAQMVAAMEGIRVSSQDIAKIIKVIDEIAFQTNLLALNAAVEAARAGQHGRGFAVVAQEVRNLAGRSAKAARETSDYIEDATVRVRDGVRIADETSKSFGQISQDIEKVRALVSEIATASAEQSRGVAQINSAIGEVAKSALSTSQQADELAASAAEMQSATENMRREVERFRLRKPEPVTMAMPGLDQLPAELLAQFQQMLALHAAGSRAEPAMPARRNGAGPRSTDHDERGFAGF
ncbi:MAG: methyl-accepting chemotaxis protein [Gemmobacter sp.]|nr:methyl-accepting chemotaxis protein [Gemmobacter sp.]